MNRRSGRADPGRTGTEDPNLPVTAPLPIQTESAQPSGAARRFSSLGVVPAYPGSEPGQKEHNEPADPPAQDVSAGGEPADKKKNRFLIPAILAAALILGLVVGVMIYRARFGAAEDLLDVSSTGEDPAMQSLDPIGTEEARINEIRADISGAVVSVSSVSNIVSSDIPSGKEGTGFFLTQDGYLLTTYQTIRPAAESPYGSIEVILFDGREFSAELVSYDSGFDLALLHVSAESGMLFMPARLGSSVGLMPDDEVVIVGKGEETEVRRGRLLAVSALPQQNREEDLSQLLLSADAPISPEYAGAPLLDMEGFVIGIVTANQSVIHASFSEFTEAAKSQEDGGLVSVLPSDVKNLCTAIPIDYPFIQAWLVMLQNDG